MITAVREFEQGEAALNPPRDLFRHLQFGMEHTGTIPVWISLLSTSSLANAPCIAPFLV